MDAAGYVTPEEVRLALQKVHSEDIETNPEKALRHALADDLKPVDAAGTLEAKLAGDSRWRNCLSHCWACSFTFQWA